MSSDLDAARAALGALPARLDTALVSLLDERARLAEETLRDATPIRTGATASAWTTDETGPLERTVFNAYTTERGFLVASGLITGTGSRGVATTGYVGSFAAGWPGMHPNPDLHAAWEDLAHQPLSEGSIDLGV